MKLMSAALILFIAGCSHGDDKAIAFCADKQGVAGYQTRWGVPVVVCNNGQKKTLD